MVLGAARPEKGNIERDGDVWIADLLNQKHYQAAHQKRQQCSQQKHVGSWLQLHFFVASILCFSIRLWLEKSCADSKTFFSIRDSTLVRSYNEHRPAPVYLH
jgi:hypothetical protein